MGESGLIERIDRTDRNLLVWMHGRDAPVTLPWIWVRDHSRDPTAYDADNAQRLVDTFAIGTDLRARRIDLEDDTVTVEWHGSTPPSALPGAVIAEAVSEPPSSARLWHRGGEPDVAPVGYADLDTEAGRDRWLDDIAELGFGLVRDVPPGRDAVVSLVGRIGYVRRTVFGDIWTLERTAASHPDSAYGEATLEPHTDGSYAHDAPGLQLFVCQERTGDGGESVLVDGFAVADALRTTEPDAFATLTEVPVPGQYLEPGVHLRASRPTIRLDRTGAVDQVTFNNYDRAPFHLAPDSMHRWYEAYGAFHDLVADRSRWWVQRLEPGDGLIVDNWRCLHGRTAFSGTRVFEGCYINHEDFESALRLRRQSRATPSGLGSARRNAP